MLLIIQEYIYTDDDDYERDKAFGFRKNACGLQQHIISV